jgi:hypothetical protein
MPTIKKGTIEYQIHAAPDSPLNLKLGVIYGPRRRDESGGDFEGYSCVEVERGWFVVAGWGRGRTAGLWEGQDLMRAYAELATFLGYAK